MVRTTFNVEGLPKIMRKSRMVTASFLVAAMLAAASLLLPSGGCAISLPHLNDIWGSSSSDVFMVGDSGTILHYDGSIWSSMNSGTTGYLSGVWGTSSSDVFAVGGGGTIIHYDGTSWSQMNSGTSHGLNDVWGVSSSDVFVVGTGSTAYTSSTILHYDGSEWSIVWGGANQLEAVSGTSAINVFAVGRGGTILHYDGSDWSAMPSPSMDSLHDVCAISSSEVWAVGDSGTILHYDGSTWSSMNSGTTGYLGGVWGNRPTDIFAVGVRCTILHYAGGGWGPSNANCEKPNHPPYAIWGSSQSDVFALTDSGILHWKGNNWSHVQGPSTFVPLIYAGLSALGVCLLIASVICARSYKSKRSQAKVRIQDMKSEITAMIEEAIAENGVADEAAAQLPQVNTGDANEAETGKVTKQARVGGPTAARPLQRISDHKWHDMEYDTLPKWVKGRIKTLDQGKELTGMSFRYRRHSQTGRYQRRLRR